MEQYKIEDQQQQNTQQQTAADSKARYGYDNYFDYDDDSFNHEFYPYSSQYQPNYVIFGEYMLLLIMIGFTLIGCCCLIAVLVAFGMFAIRRVKQNDVVESSCV